MDADVQVAQFVALLRRVVAIAKTRDNAIPAGKTHAWYSLKLERRLKEMEDKFHFTRADLHLLITELKTIDGEQIPGWII